ncbi:MAG: OadG family protein [Clostridiales bacterium]|nr:OadG family protein [Clostridiales bacterium]
MNQVVVESIKILGMGMGTVFVVLALFYAIVKGLNRLFPSN